MSNLILPAGTKIVASLFRPVKESPGIGLAVVIAKEGAGLLQVTAGLLLQADRMLEALPELMMPGAPVTCLLHIHLPTGKLTVSSCSLVIERAMPRAAAADRLFGDMFMQFVACAFENALFVDTPAAVSVSNGNHLVQ